VISLTLLALSLSVQPAQSGYTCTAASSKGQPCIAATYGQRGTPQRDTLSDAQRAERMVCNPDQSKNRACHHDKLSLTADRHAQDRAQARSLAPTLAEND
jgi:hypothetical protein